MRRDAGDPSKENSASGFSFWNGICTPGAWTPSLTAFERSFARGCAGRMPAAAMTSRPAKIGRICTSVFLEFVPQSELHHPCRLGTRDLAERARAGQAQLCRCRVVEIDVIERVESFGSELDPLALPRELDALGDREINGSEPGAANDTPSADRAGILSHEALVRIRVAE